MAFLRPLTANLNPHPTPVAPLAGQSGDRGGLRLRCLSALAEKYSDVRARGA